MDITSPIAQMWKFVSQSNSSKIYETLKRTNGTLSCNCPGWTRRVAADGTRSCCHVRSVEAGTADAECLSQVNYQEPSQVPATSLESKIQTPKKTTKKLVPTPMRRINWR